MNKKIHFYAMTALLLLIGCVGFGYYQLNESKLPGEHLIRFHVIANSDSPYDQQLKLKVRDAVIDYLAADLELEQDADQARKMIASKIPEIEAVAKNVLAGAVDYDVHAELGHFNFPTKSYGEFVLPAGNYEALRIRLGEAKGKNWWCVLFPPLCFVDITGNIAQAPAENGLTEGEVAATGGYLTVKMKAVEVFRPNDDDLAVITSGPVFYEEK